MSNLKQLQGKLLNLIETAKAELTPEQIIDTSFDYAELDIKCDLHIEHNQGQMQLDIECEQVTHIFREAKNIYTVRLKPVQLPDFELDITYIANSAVVELFGQDRWCVVKNIIPLR